MSRKFWITVAEIDKKDLLDLVQTKNIQKMFDLFFFFIIFALIKKTMQSTIFYKTLMH